MKFSLINALASALLFVGTVKAAPIDSRQMTPDYNPVISQVLETELKERQSTPDYNPVISQVLETELKERQLTPDYNPVISQVLEVQEDEKRDDGLREPANKHFNWELGMVI